MNYVEMWKFIPLEGFRYDVSTFGRIRNRDTYRILKQKLSWDGYPQVQIFNHIGERRDFYMHRLVAATFLGLDLDISFREIQVNHKDGNKRNPFLDNLELMTPSENQMHALDTGLVKRRGKDCYMSILTEEQVKEIRRLHSMGFSQKKLAEQFNVTNANINAIVLRKTWKYL